MQIPLDFICLFLKQTVFVCEYLLCVTPVKILIVHSNIIIIMILETTTTTTANRRFNVNKFARQ